MLSYLVVYIMFYLKLYKSVFFYNRINSLCFPMFFNGKRQISPQSTENVFQNLDKKNGEECFFHLKIFAWSKAPE